MSFGGWLQLALIVLKLAGVLTWSWWAVLAPAEVIIGGAIVVGGVHMYLMKHSPRYALSYSIDQFKQAFGRGER